MKLNCWPGCRAIVIKSNIGHEGKIVTCLRRSDAKIEWTGLGKSPAWIVDRDLSENFFGKPGPLAPDAWLRPLPDLGDEAQCNSAAWLPPVPQVQGLPSTEKPKEMA